MRPGENVQPEGEVPREVVHEESPGRRDQSRAYTHDESGVVYPNQGSADNKQWDSEHEYNDGSGAREVMKDIPKRFFQSQ